MTLESYCTALLRKAVFLSVLFLFIFGLTIDVRLLLDIDVVLTGSALVLILFLFDTSICGFSSCSYFPGIIFMPRGLITVLLFYSIPEVYKLSKFNEGILFFVVLTTSIIMMIGSISYGRPELQAINDEIPIAENSNIWNDLWNR